MSKPVRGTVQVALLAAVLAGCSASSSAGDAAEPSRSPAPPATWEEPPATREELAKAVEAFGRCLARGGVGMVNSGWDPVTRHRFILSFPAPGMPDHELTGTVDTCRGRHLDEIEARYMRSHPPEMDPRLLAATRACLAGKGVEMPSGIRSPHALIESLPAAEQDDLIDCALDGMRRLYPDLPVHSFP